jgi:hypothetical protein
MLTGQECEPLNWKKNFIYPNMFRLKTEADGSCFFHAIAKAFFLPYQTERINGMPISKKQIIKGFRHDLAAELDRPFNEDNPKGPCKYDMLSRGNLKDFAKECPQYRKKSMQKELMSSHAVDNVYNEFVSNELNKDIYILHREKQDVYITGDDIDLLYKGRQSIVLIYLEKQGHFELVGLQNEKGQFDTIFSPDHPFIQAVKNRIIQKIAVSKN